jgi:putative transposase
MNLERAYLNFFEKRAQFPKLKKRGVSDSFRYPQGCKLDQANSRVFLPKLRWVRFRSSREVLGDIANITISLKAGRWYASIQTTREFEVPKHPATGAVGIDMGVMHFATLSDGSHFESLGSFKKHQRRLEHYQRMMARRTKFGRNWHKAKKKIQTIYARIGNCRRDYLHKCSTAISQSHAMVCIEDLQVRNMTKSASGTILNPGTNVRAKSSLNRSILDQGWGEFRRQLEYKLQWNGGILVPVSPHNTSRECPLCGHTDADNRKTQSRFACVACGYENNADLVGALNILARGHRVTACRDTSSA